MQRGFTLIELMVVIVIIGILSALAVPKMFGTSAKAKAAEAPSVIANWENLQTAYIHELGAAGDYATIGFTDPSNSVSGVSKWFNYTDGGASAVSSTITAVTIFDFGNCATGDSFQSELSVAGGVTVHSAPIGICAQSYTPSFLP
jgi:type IV pilus assembly protein PilA